MFDHKSNLGFLVLITFDFSEYKSLMLILLKIEIHDFNIRCRIEAISREHGSNIFKHVEFCDFVSLRYVTDGTVAILVSMLFFVVPSRLPTCGGYGYNDEGEMLILTPLNTFMEKNPS